MYVVSPQRGNAQVFKVSQEDDTLQRTLFEGSEEQCEDWAYLMNNARAAREWQVTQIKQEAERLLKLMVKSQ